MVPAALAASAYSAGAGMISSHGLTDRCTRRGLSMCGYAQQLPGTAPAQGGPLQYRTLGCKNHLKSAL